MPVRAAVALLAFAMLALPAAAAHAEAPAGLDPVLQYSGTATTTGPESTETYPATVTIDCTNEPCLANASLYDTESTAVFTLSLDGGLPLSDGAGTFAIPERGTCDEDYVAAGTATVVADLARAVVEFAVGPGACGVDGYENAQISIDATWVSGAACLLDATCRSEPAPTATPTVAPVVAAGTDRPGLEPTPATPSTLSTLPTVAQAASPANAAWAAALTVVLVILIALPTHLLNTAIEAGSGRVGAWWARRRPDAPAAPKRRLLSGWPLAAAGVLIASLISSFVDPRFLLDATSPRVFLSVLASFVLDAVLGWFVVIWLMRRWNPDARPEFRFVPATLIVVAAAVVFSRLTGFEPGIVFGLVAGVAFGSALAVAQQARVQLVTLGYAFGAAVIAWIGYGLLTGAEGTVEVFVRETLAAVAIGGMAALPIALVPLRGLAGHAVFRWNRAVWGAAYGVGLFGFFFVLMPAPLAWDAVDLSIWAWVGIYVAYALVAVGAWLALERPWRRSTAE